MKAINIKKRTKVYVCIGRECVTAFPMNALYRYWPTNEDATCKRRLFNECQNRFIKEFALKTADQKQWMARFDRLGFTFYLGVLYPDTIMEDDTLAFFLGHCLDPENYNPEDDSSFFLLPSELEYITQRYYENITDDPPGQGYKTIWEYVKNKHLCQSQ